MNVEQFLEIFIPIGSVLGAYFKINQDINEKITTKNAEQDKLIEANKTSIQYEQRLRIEQQKNILKRVQYKILSQDEKIDQLKLYLESVANKNGLPQFNTRDSRLDIEFTRSLMNDDEPLSGDLNGS